MLNLRAFAPLALAPLLFACGGGGDDDAAPTTSGLAGMYQTTVDTVSAPCDAESMTTTTNVDPPYFLVKDEATFGILTVGVYPCTGSDASSCDDFGIVEFAQAAGAGTFRSEVTSLSSGGSGSTSCNGDFMVGEIKKTTDGVTVTTTEQSGPLSGADLCKFDNGDFTSQQKAAIKALPCTTREARQGTRL